MKTWFNILNNNNVDYFQAFLNLIQYVGDFNVYTVLYRLYYEYYPNNAIGMIVNM